MTHGTRVVIARVSDVAESFVAVLEPVSWLCTYCMSLPVVVVGIHRPVLVRVGYEAWGAVSSALQFVRIVAVAVASYHGCVYHSVVAN